MQTMLSDKLRFTTLDHSPRKNWITKAFVMSTKKAPTRGRIINAVGAGPCDFVTAAILAIAVGVAPREKPAKPALKTAAI